jgi:integrase
MASVAPREWTHNGKKSRAWVVRYVDKGGKHRSRQFERKKEADTYKREVENEMDAGTHVARRDSRTVRELIEEFKADVARRVTDQQVGRGYWLLCNTNLKYVADTIGEVLARDLRWQDVETMMLGLRTTESRYGRALERRSIRNIVTTFGTVMGYAVRRGYAARNVVPDAMREVGPTRAPGIVTFTRDEMRTLIVAAEQRGDRRERRTHFQIRAMIYLAAVCGLRKGEIAGLTWDHIDLTRGMIHIRQATDQQDNVKGPKTKAGIRDVPLPRAVAAALEDFRPYVVEDARGLIFRTKTGKKLTDVGFYKVWHPVLRRAGLLPDEQGRWRHFHALRHFAGSAWLEAGVPLPEVSRMLGHANTAITAEIYSHSIVSAGHRSTEIEACADRIMPALALPAPPPIAQELRKAA